MTCLVTGTPGSGKTSLVAFASRLNDKRFYDTDEISGLCEWRELGTGKNIGSVGAVKVVGGDDWYKRHGWYWRDDTLKKFLELHSNAVLCGSSENVAEFYPLFDKIILLRKTKDQLYQNLKSPDRKNPFGKTTIQRVGFMTWQEYLIAEAKKYPVTIIDGNSVQGNYEKVVEVIS